MKKFTRKALERWLKGFAPKTTVGFARYLSACPISNFLSSITDNETWVVDGTNAYIFHNKTGCIDNKICFILPLWACELIQRIDDLNYRPISSKTALSILKGL